MTQRHFDSSDSSKAIHMCSQKFMGVPQRLKPTDEHVLNKLLIVATSKPVSITSYAQCNFRNQEYSRSNTRDFRCRT